MGMKSVYGTREIEIHRKNVATSLTEAAWAIEGFNQLARSYSFPTMRLDYALLELSEQKEIITRIYNKLFKAVEPRAPPQICGGSQPCNETGSDYMRGKPRIETSESGFSGIRVPTPKRGSETDTAMRSTRSHEKTSRYATATRSLAPTATRYETVRTASRQPSSSPFSDTASSFPASTGPSCHSVVSRSASFFASSKSATGNNVQYASYSEDSSTLQPESPGAASEGTTTTAAFTQFMRI